MKNLNNKTKKQLIDEIKALKRQIKELEKDRSEVKKPEDALQESEERQRTIFQSTGTAMAIVEEDKILSMVNLQFEKLCGYSRKEVEGKKPWTEFIMKDDLKRMKEYHRLRRISEDLSPMNYEFRFIDRKGQIKNILLNTAMIPGTKRSMASLLDITERKNTEKALQESEERLSLALEGARLGSWDLSFKTGEVSRNEYWAKMLGYTLREIENNLNGFIKLIHPDDRAKFEKKMQEHKEGKSSDFEVEHRMLNKEGQWKWIRNWGRIVDRDDNSKPLRALGVHFDITARKQAEEELRKHRDHLKELVKERTVELEDKNKELERFNKLFVGREFRIKELRDRVKELEGKAGEKR